MKNILREEMKRALWNKGMLLALAAGLGIALSHVIGYQTRMYEINLQKNYEFAPIIPLHVVADTWIEGTTFSMESTLYFLLIPILAVLPFGTSYLSDLQNGFLKNIYMRVTRKQYLLAKYIATFLSGGVVVIVPLIVNLMCCMMRFPSFPAQHVTAFNSMSAAKTFYELYYTEPILYIMIFLVLDFILGGVFACLALSCSFLSDYKIIVSVCPFFLQLAIHVICSMNLKMDWSSVYFAQSGYGIASLVIPGIYIVTGIAISFGVFLLKGAKEDVF